MTIERTNKEVIIRLSANTNTEDLQKMVNFARYKELTSKFEISKSEVNNFVSDIKNGWSTKKQ